MAPLPFALQLHSVRAALQADPGETLKRVKAMGYQHVALAGTAGLPVATFRDLLDGAGVRAVSAQVAFDPCVRSLSSTVADCHALGVQWAAITGFEPGATGVLAELGTAFRDAGITLCHHNGPGELDGPDGLQRFDHRLAEVGPELLAIALDVGWSHYDGADTLGLLSTYAGRIPLLHVKDIKARQAGEAAVHTELGNGATPLGRILPAATRAGVQWLIVEQDESARDPMESARMNAAYMRVHVY